ncbi:UDP-glucosyltransferase 2-like [Maniola hyperantus]|uniref:UDP-glucosyltransferase 2-like n=1 Tax=Aphantopus hyperantus TaxID=2795564 RepID=UPI0015696955|nr:UDP-glucuronosyltransferase 2B19-like [Maniola hyperantus]
MDKNKSLFFLLTAIVITGIKGARILAYFPTPSISHQLVFRPLTQALAARGHEVIVVTTDPVFPKGKTPSNLTEIDVHDISYEIWEGLYQHHTGNKRDLLVQVKAVFEKFTNIFYAQAQTLEVKEILKKDRNYFDLLLLEACNRAVMGFSHIFDGPVITISSFGAVPAQYHTMGAPVHPLLYPTPGRQRLYHLSLLEKSIELLGHFLFEFLITESDDYDHRIMKKVFGKDTPTFPELTKKIQMLFLNEHPLWADNHPVPPSVLFIGGIHETKVKELPTDLKNYLDSSKHGVIYVSFGTNVLPSLLPPEKIKIMTKVFSELPYDVLWKYDKDILPGRSKNINISKWFPQPDLIRHPKIKLFITQGGLQSTDEAIDAEVPMIGIPMLVDQWYNVEKYVHHNIGLQLDITTLTEQKFKQSIEEIMNDNSFKKNITRLKSLMREYPIKPLDNAVWWTEHIIKYGGGHLKAPAADMPWTEYYEIKLVLIIFVILVTILAIVCWVMKSILKFVFNTYRTNIKLKIY